MKQCPICSQTVEKNKMVKSASKSFFEFGVWVDVFRGVGKYQT